MSSIALLPGEEIRFLETKPVLAPGILSNRRRSCWLGRATVLLVVGPIVVGMAIGIIDADREMRRKQCSDRLTKIGLALHKYHDIHGHFPAPAIVAQRQPHRS